MGRIGKKSVEKKKPYDISDVEKALKEVNKGSSIHAVSKEFNIPYATLYSRVKGTYPLDAKPGPSSILSSYEERELVQWIFTLTKCGFHVTKEHLLNSVQSIVKSEKIITPFTNGRPSKHWYKAFLKRNPEISEKMLQHPVKTEASTSEENLKTWSKKIRMHVASRDLDDIGPERIFNIDEVIFFFNPKDKILIRRGEKSLYNVFVTDKDRCTVLIGGNAAGQLLPPMVVFNYERIPTAILKHLPDDFIVGKGVRGWITTETFYSYIVNHFYQWCINNDITFPIILYVDAHSSYLTKGLSDFCCSHEIELVALCPYATHLMQPMDIALFSPLKVAYRDAIHSWRMEHNNEQLTKICFPSVLRTALDSLDYREIFKSGFAKCGLFPLSENDIKNNNLMTNSETVKSSQNEQEFSENITDDTEVALFEANINFVESNINPFVLERFKRVECGEWTGAVEYTELFNFWLRCKSTVSDQSTNQENT